MNGLDNYYNTLQAEYQRRVDEAAEREEEEEEFKPSAEDLAFVESYATCVAVGSREDVLKFLAILDPDKQTVMPDYIFTSIEDAWLVWKDAMNFAKTVLNNDSKKG